MAARRTFFGGGGSGGAAGPATVEVYADATARDVALPAPAEGTLAFVGDELQVYAGGTWTVVIPLGSRQVATYATASLAAEAEETGVITLAPSYRLLTIETSQPARVRVYTTAAHRTADAARPIGTAPDGDHGLVLEYVTTAEVLAAGLSPVVDGFSGETPPSAAIPLAVSNLDVEGAITVDFAWIATEA